MKISRTKTRLFLLNALIVLSVPAFAFAQDSDEGTTSSGATGGPAQIWAGGARIAVDQSASENPLPTPAPDDGSNMPGDS
jgi:hypothetical protein